MPPITKPATKSECRGLGVYENSIHSTRSGQPEILAKPTVEESSQQRPSSSCANTRSLELYEILALLVGLMLRPGSERVVGTSIAVHAHHRRAGSGWYLLLVV